MNETEKRSKTVRSLILAVGVSLWTVFTITACAKQGGADEETTVQQTSALETHEEKTSYALGMVLGHQLRERGVEVDLDLYVKGLADGLSGGDTLLTRSEARAAVNALQSELATRRTARANSPAGIRVLFKLDPRLTRGLHMGDGWVSPPTYMSTLQPGEKAFVDARAEVPSFATKAANDTKWIPADPNMVTVSPDSGRQVRITAHSAGETSLLVKAGDMSRNLNIKATYREEEDVTQLEISQRQ